MTQSNLKAILLDFWRVKSLILRTYSYFKLREKHSYKLKSHEFITSKPLNANG